MKVRQLKLIEQLKKCNQRDGEGEREIGAEKRKTKDLRRMRNCESDENFVVADLDN